MSKPIYEARVRFKQPRSVMSSGDPRYKPRQEGGVTIYPFPNLTLRISHRDRRLIVDVDGTGRHKEIWIGDALVAQGRSLQGMFFPLLGVPPPKPKRAKPRKAPPRKPLSVVVTTYDRPAHLGRTLAGLLPQLRKGDEAIVIDDGGPPKKVPKVVRYVRQHRLGYRLATARNRGLALAVNRFAVILDDDCVPDEGFLDAYRSRIGVGKLLLGGLRFQLDEKGAKFRERRKSIPLLKGRLEGGYGGNTCFAVEDAKAVGGFDERLNGCWGYEDTCFIRAMMLSGVAVEPCFEAKATHLWSPARADFEKCMERNRGICRELAKEYERKRFPAPSPVWGEPLLAEPPVLWREVR